jgi:hypothetical protein
MSVLTKMLKDDQYAKKITFAAIFVRTLMDATVTVTFPNHKKHCTKKWPFLGINMVYTIYLDKEQELCLDVCFVGKLL